MSFLDTIFSHLESGGDAPALVELHGVTEVPTSWRDLYRVVSRARGKLRSIGVQPGDRVGLFAANSTRWVAADLAALAEGAVVAPMYARQSPDEVVAQLRDCGASLVVCGNAELLDAVRSRWPEVAALTLGELFDGEPLAEAPATRQADAPVTLIYTSGTSGAAKGVVTTTANVDFMLPTTASALAKMMGTEAPTDRVFHYLPFCFSGSRMVLWTCLFRGNCLHMSTNLDRLAEELGAARPNYFLNVPVLLERIRAGVEGKIAARGAAVSWLWRQGQIGAIRQLEGRAPRKRDRLLLPMARRVVLDKVRAQIGPELKCLICGSAPLSEETQRWFEALGIPVYQVYGLTETTAIVTMDRPPKVKPGLVGPVIDGVQVRISEQGELQVRGPNVFGGYWGNQAATDEAFDEGWFKTGDQAERDGEGYLRLVGRLRNVLVPASGHNIPPEPIEQQLAEALPGVGQVVVFGHGRPHLVAVAFGWADQAAADAAIARVNEALPHYKRVRAVSVVAEALTPESGLLTANAKLKRGPIAAHFADRIDRMYA